MRYTILIYGNPEVGSLFAAMTEDERKAAFAIYFEVESDLENSGELVDSKAIDEEGQLQVLVNSDGAVTTEKVPTPSITGYYLVEVADEARAIEIAARFPEARVPGGVRVARNFTDEDFAALGMIG